MIVIIYFVPSLMVEFSNSIHDQEWSYIVQDVPKVRSKKKSEYYLQEST